MKSIQFLTAIIVAGSLGACSSTPVVDNGAASSQAGTPGQPSTQPNPQPPANSAPAVSCLQNCLFTVEQISESGIRFDQAKLSGNGDVFGTRDNKPVKFSNGILEELPIPAQVNGADLANDVITHKVTVNDAGDYMVSRRITNPFLPTRDQSWIVRTNRTLFKVGFSGGIALSQRGFALSDGFATNSVWNLNTDTVSAVSGATQMKAINDSGVAVGQGGLIDGAGAISLRNGLKTRLGGLDAFGRGPGLANDINNAGVIVGSSTDTGKKRAFRYFDGPDGLKMYGMNTDCETSEAIAINESGNSVLNGTGCPDRSGNRLRALLSKPDLSSLNLNDHIAKKTWALTSVLDINNNGQILALGTRFDGRTIFVLKLNPI
jgi:probable HAF family extracellular repeat protein